MGGYCMDHDYTVEIEYLAKETIPIKALSKEWAEIVAREKWEHERPETITAILIEEQR